MAAFAYAGLVASVIFIVAEARKHVPDAVLGLKVPPGLVTLLALVALGAMFANAASEGGPLSLVVALLSLAGMLVLALMSGWFRTRPSSPF